MKKSSMVIKAKTSSESGTLIVKDYRGISCSKGSSTTYTREEIKMMMKKYLMPFSGIRH